MKKQKQLCQALYSAYELQTQQNWTEKDLDFINKVLDLGAVHRKSTKPSDNKRFPMWQLECRFTIRGTDTFVPWKECFFAMHWWSFSPLLAVRWVCVSGRVFTRALTHRVLTAGFHGSGVVNCQSTGAVASLSAAKYFTMCLRSSCGSLLRIMVCGNMHSALNYRCYRI